WSPGGGEGSLAPRGCVRDARAGAVGGGARDRWAGRRTLGAASGASEPAAAVDPRARAATGPDLRRGEAGGTPPSLGALPAVAVRVVRRRLDGSFGPRDGRRLQQGVRVSGDRAGGCRDERHARRGGARRGAVTVPAPGGGGGRWRPGPEAGSGSLPVVRSGETLP